MEVSGSIIDDIYWHLQELDAIDQAQCPQGQRTTLPEWVWNHLEAIIEDLDRAQGEA